MKSTNSEFSIEYLALIKRIFTKRYKKDLADETVIRIARHLSRFGAVCHNFDRKKKGFQPIYSI